MLIHAWRRSMLLWDPTGLPRNPPGSPGTPPGSPGSPRAPHANIHPFSGLDAGPDTRLDQTELDQTGLDRVFGFFKVFGPFSGFFGIGEPMFIPRNRFFIKKTNI